AAWSPDGTLIVTGTLSDGHRVWDASTGDLVQRLAADVRADFAVLEPPNVTSFSKRGDRLATLFDERVKVFHTNGLAGVPAGDSAKAVAFEAACEDSVARFVRLAPDGAVVAARCGRTLTIWSINANRKIWSQPLHDDYDPEPQFAFVFGGRALV